jgi:hypothetical protein
LGGRKQQGNKKPLTDSRLYAGGQTTNPALTPEEWTEKTVVSISLIVPQRIDFSPLLVGQCQ